MSAPARFVELSWRDRFLLLEAVLLLGCSALCIALLSFERVTRIAAGRRRGRQPASAAQARRISWAVTACAKRVPWRAACFERGLAAQFLLRRRDLKSELYYGIRPDHGQGLTAHVWVRSGEVDVIGCETAGEFGQVATFGA